MSECEECKKNQEIIKRHGNVIPIVKLEKIFTHKMQSENTKNKIIGITVEAKNKNIILCVDEIVSSQQVVLRQMKGIETEDQAFAGAALLGDGNIAMIIDLENIIARVME